MGIQKSIDLSIFLISQLISVLQFGFEGVQVTGYVTKQWKLRKKNKLSTHSIVGTNSNYNFDIATAVSDDDYCAKLIEDDSL